MGKAHQNQYSGTGFKPPLGAAIKSCGTERKWKRLTEISQVCAIKLNESEQSDEASLLLLYSQN
ncbi:hypothetical protein CN535_26425 [Bacillus pseudomycoides]|nr:hypothetical protein BLX05_14355 [Bacillus pseudomycoides]PDY08746.1 hypothetical protein COO16_29050 [Bacillus pseudomycoides]PEU33620.1 hypothetical protein CN535_26425 [Bacillus pseudomycoides]PFY15161.1 hypothetical protein COL42_17265 [Bacillus pseudomycoides]PGA69990.1 hypothetical protein COL89_17880 [Bacillus pseudomycoides]